MLEAFTTEVRRPDAELRLDRAALLIAAAEYPDLDVDAWLARLDGMGTAVAARIPLGAPATERARVLRAYLYDELQFAGNRNDYYDPRNSYLNDVLERRTGIPISLAVVFLEVGRRAGLAATGVSYPGHFLVKYTDGDDEWIVDPFERGDEFPGHRFRERLAEGGTPDHVMTYYLSGVTRRQMLARMLLNLKMVYLQRRDVVRSLRTQELAVALNPWSFPEIRDRGALRARAGDIAGALADLQTYVDHAAGEADVPAVQRMVEQLRGGPLP